jgi:hypothetical protein
MPNFVDLGITTDARTLADNAIGALEDAIPGYVPKPGNLEVIQADALAPMAAEQAIVASQVPPAVFRAFGTQLVGIAFESGASATAALTVTAVDTVGYTLDAGTDLTIGGLDFQILSDIVVPAGSTTATGTAVAAELGTAYNGVSSPVYLIDSLDWLSSIAVTGASANGVDAEGDSSYQDRLAGLLQLQAPRPITANDYATFVLSFQPAAGTAQEQVGRATAIDGYSPAVGTFTGDTTSGSATVASVSSFADVTVGSAVSGTGIPARTTVLSINTGASTLTLSHNATASNTGVTITSTGTYGNSRTVAVFVAAADGTDLSGTTRTAVAAWLATYREANFVINVLAPTYTTVYATASIKLYPGVDPTAAAAAVQAAIIAYLSPAQFGTPQTNVQGGWSNDTAVRYNKLLGIIEQVAGVDYAPSLAIGLSASPAGTVDLTLPGPAPLPQSTTVSVPLPTVV